MANYCTDDDLVKIRPNILDFGVEDLDDQMEEATKVINRQIEAGWYRGVAEDYVINWRETAFDQDKLLNAASQLTRAGSYKSLELIYMFLMKDTPEADGFDRERKLFKSLFDEEIKSVLAVGLDYDWDESSEIEAGENLQPRVRRLMKV